MLTLARKRIVPSVASVGKNPSFLPTLNTLTALCRGMPSGSVSFAVIQILVKVGMTPMMITKDSA